MLDLKKLKRHFFKKNKKYNFFLIVTPSFEKLALEELKEFYFNIENVEIVKGGISFTSDLSVINVIHNYCRIPIRLLLRLGKFICNSEKQIYNNLLQIPFENYIGDNLLNIEVSSRSSWIYNEKKLKNIIEDFFMTRYNNLFSLDNEGISLFFRINHNKLTVSLDLTGEPLYKRGISKLKSQTPMRESNIAAAMRFIGIEKYKYIIDPFCGAGTILIESYMKLKNILPEREFNFYKMPITYFIKNIDFPVLDKTKKIDQMFIGLDISFKNLKIFRKNIDNLFEKDSIFLINSNSLFFPLKLKNDEFIIFSNPPFGWKLLDRKKADFLLDSFFKVMFEYYKQFKFGIFYPENRLLDSLSSNKVTFPFGGRKINFYYN